MYLSRNCNIFVLFECVCFLFQFFTFGFTHLSRTLLVSFGLTGWLDCPPYGQEINYLIPSKTPLGDGFDIPPGKRYSFKQVLHQQRVLGRKVSGWLWLHSLCMLLSDNIASFMQKKPQFCLGSFFLVGSFGGGGLWDMVADFQDVQVFIDCCHLLRFVKYLYRNMIHALKHMTEKTRIPLSLWLYPCHKTNLTI